jgi:hypothetical protein
MHPNAGVRLPLSASPLDCGATEARDRSRVARPRVTDAPGLCVLQNTRVPLYWVGRLKVFGSAMRKFDIRFVDLET